MPALTGSPWDRSGEDGDEDEGAEWLVIELGDEFSDAFRSALRHPYNPLPYIEKAEAIYEEIKELAR